MTRSGLCKKIQDVWVFPQLQPSHSPNFPKASPASGPGHQAHYYVLLLRLFKMDWLLIARWGSPKPETASLGWDWLKHYACYLLGLFQRMTCLSDDDPNSEIPTDPEVLTHLGRPKKDPPSFMTSNVRIKFSGKGRKLSQPFLLKMGRLSCSGKEELFAKDLWHSTSRGRIEPSFIESMEGTQRHLPANCCIKTHPGTSALSQRSLLQL